MFWWILSGVLLLLLLLALVTVYICFYKIFLTHRKKKSDEIHFPPGEEYLPYREQIVDWMNQNRKVPCRLVSTRSFDRLTLYGKYYEYEKNAPIELMLHGYRGEAECDLACGVERCFALGHSALIIDHRACGKSEGRVITFGIHESRDVHSWVDYIIQHINPNAKIILTGISMGAATATICAGEDFPENVVGVLADCGYTSAKDIIQKVMVDMKLSPKLLYPFAKVAARLFGGFDLEEKSPLEAMKTCRLPILFFHGDADGFVPCEMSERNYAACVFDNKKLVITKGAGHVLCYMTDSEGYLAELRAFFEPLVR